MIYSPIEKAKQNRHNAYAYLQYLFIMAPRITGQSGNSCHQQYWTVHTETPPFLPPCGSIDG